MEQQQSQQQQGDGKKGPEETVREALKRVQGKLYECRLAAKRYFCASSFSKCRRMALPPGVAPPGVIPTFPTLPCRSLCDAYERACRVKDETCTFLSDEQPCNL